MKSAFVLAGFAAVSLTNPICASGQSSWRLSEVPTLEIGTVDGPVAVTFHDVRGAMSIQDSLIVIADGGAKELRVFSNSGDFITKFGREGGGPREFEGMGWADTCGSDTVVAYDFAATESRNGTPRGRCSMSSLYRVLKLRCPPTHSTVAPTGRSRWSDGQISWRIRVE